MIKEIEHLQYLDKFLSILKSSPEGKQNYAQLYEIFLSKEYDSNKSNFDSLPIDAFRKQKKGSDVIPIDWSKSERYKENVFNSAFNFLQELGLIVAFETKEVVITFKGHMKTTNTFVDEYKTERLRKSVSWWQRIGIWVAVIFSFCSLSISVYDHFYKSPAKIIHEIYNKNCNNYEGNRLQIKKGNFQNEKNLFKQNVN
jgi:hypothetical protein